MPIKQANDALTRPAYLLAIAVCLTLLGKLGALFRDIFLAFAFGAGANIDAYFVANIIPGLLWAAALATIAAVVLPLYVAVRDRDPPEAERLAVESVRIYLWAGTIMAALVWVLAGPIVRVTASEAAPQTIDLAIKLTRIMALGFVFTGYVGVQSALQQANGRYLAPLTVPVINHVITIIAILIAGYFEDVSIAIAGAALGWMIQAPLQRYQTRPFYSFKPGLFVRAKSLRLIALLSLPVALGMFLDQANIYIGIMLASGFGEGAVAHLGYASRLALFMANLVSWLVAYFLFPRIAVHAARGDDLRSGRELGVGMVLIAGLTLPMLVVSLIFARDVIALVYGRGEFDGAAIAATASVFMFYTLGIIFMGLRELLNRAFFSYQRTAVPMVVGVIAAAVNLAASLILSQIYGLAGIAMGASISALVFVVLQLGVIMVWKPQLIDNHAVRQIAVLAGAALIAGGAAHFALPAFANWPLFLRLLAATSLTGAVYLGVIAALDRLFGLRFLDLAKTLKGTNIPDAPAIDPDPVST